MKAEIKKDNKIHIIPENPTDDLALQEVLDIAEKQKVGMPVVIHALEEE